MEIFEALGDADCILPEEKAYFSEWTGTLPEKGVLKSRPLF